MKMEVRGHHELDGCATVISLVFFCVFFLDEIIAHSEVVVAVVVGFSRTG